MYRRPVAAFVRFAYDKAIAGDDSIMMRATHPEVSFHFPGTSSFGASLVGREALSQWLSRFRSMEPKFEIDDVAVSGAPWNLTVAVRFHDSIGDSYRNEGVEWLRIRRGRVRSLEVFLDTQRIEAWENRQLASA
jgi:ketosteroid isomerase-like protein